MARVDAELYFEKFQARSAAWNKKVEAIIIKLKNGADPNTVRDEVKQLREEHDKEMDGLINYIRAGY